MPWAAIAPGIPAMAGALGGAALASRSSNRAASEQARATREALAFEREREEQRRKEYQEQQALMKAQWEAQEARLAPRRAARDAVLRRFGFEVPVRATTMPAGYQPGVATATATAPRKPATLASLAGYQPQAPPIQAPQLTLADLGFGRREPWRA